MVGRQAAMIPTCISTLLCALARAFLEKESNVPWIDDLLLPDIVPRSFAGPIFDFEEVGLHWCFVYGNGRREQTET